MSSRIDPPDRASRHRRHRHGRVPRRCEPDRRAPPRHHHGRADTIRNLAVLLARLRRDGDSARMLGACHDRTGGVYGSEAKRLDDVRAELRRRLGAHGFDDQWQRGRTMSPDEAVAAALLAIDDAFSRA